MAVKNLHQNIGLKILSKNKFPNVKIKIKINIKQDDSLHIFYYISVNVSILFYYMHSVNII